jgi:hypothetical protein
MSFENINYIFYYKNIIIITKIQLYNANKKYLKKLI